MTTEAEERVVEEQDVVEMCPRGLHPMVPDNIYEWQGWDEAKGKMQHVRRCKACQKDASRRSAEKRKRKKEGGLPKPGGREYDDLDLALLRVLPDEGSKLGKYLDDMRTANQLIKTLDDPYITSGMLGRRLSDLGEKGLVVKAGRSGMGGKRASGYQRTDEGKKVVEGENG